MFADFEAYNGTDNFSVGVKTSNIYMHNPVSNVYYIILKLNDVLRSGY